MAFEFIPASQITRTTTPLLIALDGLTGSGKTYSALLIAQAIAKARGGDVLFIDSDNGRGLDYGEEPEHYPHLNPYHYSPMAAPYSSERYEEALLAADNLKPGCVILDTGSDEWEYVLDEKDRIAMKMALAGTGGSESRFEKMTAPAWARVKPPHKRMIRTMTKLATPLIVCFKSDLITPIGQGGKFLPQIIKPVSDPRTPFLFRFILHMKQYAKGGYEDSFKFYEHEEHIFPAGGRIDAAAAQRLADAFFSKTREAPTAARETPPAQQAPATQAGPAWELDAQGRFQCKGDPKAENAQRSLFRAIKAALDPEKNKTDTQKNITGMVMDENQDLIDALPEAGKQDISRMRLALIATKQEGK